MKREQVLPHAMADMAARIAKGADEYGEPLTTGNGRDALVDAYEEALDLAVYLKQAIMERDVRRAELPMAIAEAISPSGHFDQVKFWSYGAPQAEAAERRAEADRYLASLRVDAGTIATPELLSQIGVRVGAAPWPGPDWSQAPEWAMWWAMDDTPSRARCAYWHLEEPNRPVPDYNSWMSGSYDKAPDFGYTGDCRDSLRKRLHVAAPAGFNETNLPADTPPPARAARRERSGADAPALADAEVSADLKVHSQSPAKPDYASVAEYRGVFADNDGGLVWGWSINHRCWLGVRFSTGETFRMTNPKDGTWKLVKAPEHKPREPRAPNSHRYIGPDELT